MFVYFYISIIYNVNDGQENDMFQNNVTSMSQQGNFIEIWFEERLKIICFGIQHKNRLMGRPGDLWCRAHSMTARYLTLAVSCQIWHEKQNTLLCLLTTMWMPLYLRYKTPTIVGEFCGTIETMQEKDIPGHSHLFYVGLPN